MDSAVQSYNRLFLVKEGSLMMCYFAWLDIVQELDNDPVKGSAVRMNGYFGPALEVFLNAKKRKGDLSVCCLKELYALESQDPVGPEWLLDRFLEISIEFGEDELIWELLFGRQYSYMVRPSVRHLKAYIKTMRDDTRVLDWLVRSLVDDIDRETLMWAKAYCAENGKMDTHLYFQGMIVV